MVLSHVHIPTPYPDHLYCNDEEVDDVNENGSDTSSVFSFASPTSSLCSSPPAKEHTENSLSIPAVLESLLVKELGEAINEIFFTEDWFMLGGPNKESEDSTSFDPLDETDPFVEKCISPISAHNFALAISVLTKVPVELAICKTITTCKVFESKEQVLRAAIILIARHVFYWIPINMIYLITSAVFIAFKCFSPSSDFEHLCIDWWAGKIGVSENRLRRWEIRFLKVIGFDIYIQREEWMEWETWINNLETSSCKK